MICDVKTATQEVISQHVILTTNCRLTYSTHETHKRENLCLYMNVSLRSGVICIRVLAISIPLLQSNITSK